MTNLLDRRLIFVTGKGGVGKTTVAAALGMLASRRGKRVLVCEVEAKGDLRSVYECGPTGYEPVQVTDGLYVMSMDTEASLREYLRLNLKIPAVGRLGPVAAAFDFVATAAPGVREVLSVGKLCYEVRTRHYDLVVVDASASGHFLGQLSAPVGVNELVRMGAVRSQTRWMLDILTDERSTGVLVVATPEEMAVAEAIELVGRLGAETGVRLAAVVANRVLPELFGRREEELFSRLSAPPEHDELVSALSLSDPAPLDAVLEAARISTLERRAAVAHLSALGEVLEPGVPLVHLPFLFGRSHGPRAIRQIADRLAEEIDE